MRRRLAATGLVLVVASSTLGCAGRDPGSPSGDCAFVVRRDGHEYADAGFATQDFRPIGTAEVADCREQGPEALGPYFGDDPAVTEVSSVDELDPTVAIAVRDASDDETLRVLVSLDAPPDQVDAAMTELAD